MTETVATKKYPLLLANERIGRLDFFLCTLINIAISIIDIVSHIPNISESTYTIINGFVGIFQFYFILVQIIKRLHDSNLNRVYVLIWLTPLVATVVLAVTTQNESVSLLILIPSIFMLYLLFKKGYEHINKYGLPPANILATAVTYTEIPTKTEKTIQKKNNELTDETLFDIEYLHKSTWKTSFLIAGNIYKKQTITKKLKKIVYNTSNKYKEFYKSFKEGEVFTLCFSAITNSNMRGSSDYKYL